ncbi:MAG: fibronectin type III domain-containing protein, partial [Firmicutes bacterium]|nr:fibronectin type III domain-containing protein [Bacillota bacterium]
ISTSRELTTADLAADKKSLSPAAIQSAIKVTQLGVDVSKWCTFTSAVSGNNVTVTATIANGDGTNVVNSSISKSFTMKTNMSDCVIEILDYKQVYSGEALKPAVKVYNLLNSSVLKENLDYILEYKDNVNAGYATVTAKGVGNFTGTTVMYFVIEPKNLYNCTTFITGGRSSSAFTGKEIQPQVTIRDGVKKVLAKDKDYTIKYIDKDNRVVTGLKEAGEYTVTVEGLNNYTGKVVLPYEIIGTDVDGYKITLRYDKVKADGTAKVPEILTVKLGETSMLTTSEYDVSYLDPSGHPVTEMIKPGVYTVVVTAKNGFSGTITTTFEIVGAEQEITGVKNTYKAYKETANFKLEAAASGDGTGFTFESSEPSVASVSADGVVDVKKLGRAVITIKTVGDTIYQPAEKSVIVMVYPYKAVMTKKPWTDGAKKSFKVRWETQPDVTYYQVRYSRNKNFKSGTYNTKKVTQNTKGYKTQSTTIKNLKSGQKYYVKVRAVKVVENELGEKLYYYGTWSSWKSVKTK